jgi:tetratricopeptide (TPR) repeat protein
MNTLNNDITAQDTSDVAIAPASASPKQEDDECPICLDEVSLLSPYKRFSCCGKVLHTHCATDLKTSKMKWNCPLCRAKTPTSDEEAVAQIRPWVKKKKAWAQNMMGQMYRDGEGVKQSYEMARILYELAAQQGDADAMCSLGHMYQTGLGVEQSYERAFEYIEQAADLGYSEAQYNLGVLYEHGKGLEQSYARAKECYEQAADLGHAQAQYNLGCLYANGQGVGRDLEKARELMTKAAAQGHENAIDGLQRIDISERRTTKRNTTATTSSSDPNEIVCSNCYAPKTEKHKLIRCPCHSVQYCNKACQKSHRQQHKKECRRLLEEKKSNTTQ